MPGPYGLRHLHKANFSEPESQAYPVRKQRNFLSEILLIALILSKILPCARNPSKLFSPSSSTPPRPPARRPAASASGSITWRPSPTQVETDTYGNALAVPESGRARPRSWSRATPTKSPSRSVTSTTTASSTSAASAATIAGLARGQRVHVHGRNGEVLGVIGALAIHMQDRGKKAGGARAARTLHRHRRDQPQGGRKARRGRRSHHLHRRLAAAQRRHLHRARLRQPHRHLRRGGDVLRLCAKAGKKLKANVVAASAIGEENGLYGAQMLGYSVQAPTPRWSSTSARPPTFRSPTKSVSATRVSARVRSSAAAA